MNEYEDRYREETLGDRFKQFTRWLTRRPVESWAFFAAGVIIARVLF